MNAKLKILIAMASFGTLGLFVKNIPLPSAEIALFRAIIATIAIAIFKFTIRDKMNVSEIKKDLPLLFLSGIAIGFNWIFFFEAYRYTTVSLATLSYYFAPVIVMLVSPLLFKERLTMKQVICFFMSTMGLVLIIGISDTNSGSDPIKGIMFGLMAATLYATVIILNKFIKKVKGIDRTLLQFIAAIIVLLPYLLMTSGIHIDQMGTSGFVNLLIVGLFHTGFLYVLYFSSLKDLKGQEAAILSYVDPLVAVFVSVIFLGEAIGLLQILGGLLILGFTLLNEIDLKWVKRIND
jgi:RarD protein